MKNAKNKLKRLLSFILAGIFISGVAYAAVSSKIFMKGALFTTATMEIKFLKDITGGNISENLVTELTGVSFDNIYNYWSTDYLVKLVNISSNNVNISSYANYTTAEDPASLRYSLFVEIIKWNDKNSNGIVDEGELGDSLGKKNFVKWKTEGFNLGVLEPGVVSSYILRFSAENLTETKVGQSGKFDFEFGIMQ